MVIARFPRSCARVSYDMVIYTGYSCSASPPSRVPTSRSLPPRVAPHPFVATFFRFYVLCIIITIIIINIIIIVAIDCTRWLSRLSSIRSCIASNARVREPDQLQISKCCANRLFVAVTRYIFIDRLNVAMRLLCAKEQTQDGSGASERLVRVRAIMLLTIMLILTIKTMRWEANTRIRAFATG